jgi:hypothetical protein
MESRLSARTSSARVPPLGVSLLERMYPGHHRTMYPRRGVTAHLRRAAPASAPAARWRQDRPPAVAASGRCLSLGLCQRVRRRLTGRAVTSAAAPRSTPASANGRGRGRSLAGARCSCARRARPILIGPRISTDAISVRARGFRRCWITWCVGSAGMQGFRRALSSAGERRPYKAEVVGSIPTAPTLVMSQDIVDRCLGTS